MNIVSVITTETQAHHDRVAVVEEDRSVTYGQLLDRVEQLALQLTRRGVRPGWRVAFHSHDGIDYIVGALAILRAGAAVTPMPDALTHEELHAIIQRMDVQAVLRQHQRPRTDIDLPEEPVDDTFFWHPRSTRGELDDRCEQLHAAFVRFSSGTTGQSKGVLLSHESIIDRTDAANDGLRVTCDDVILWVLGMSHHFVVSILLFLRKGATIVVGHKRFPFSVLQAAKDHPITLIYGSPVHYYLLSVSDSLPATALSTVRLAISTAMKLPPETAAMFRAKFGFGASEAYGIIEVGLPFIHDHREQGDDDTLGRPLPAYDLQIVNPDAQGVGDVMIRGKGMFDAYVSPWRLREDVLEGGYFATGDLGRLDEQGRLKLLGRRKTVIVCAGMKIFPEEVEAIIDTHPQVIASLVYGQDHPQFGQAPVAKVQLKPAVREDPQRQEVLRQLRGHCLAKLTSYKTPVAFEAVDQLPRTPSGKLVRTIGS